MCIVASAIYVDAEIIIIPSDHITTSVNHVEFYRSAAGRRHNTGHWLDGQGHGLYLYCPRMYTERRQRGRSMDGQGLCRLPAYCRELGPQRRVDQRLWECTEHSRTQDGTCTDKDKDCTRWTVQSLSLYCPPFALYCPPYTVQ